MPKPFQTPADQVAIVAAILAASGPKINPEEGKPNHQFNTMRQRDHRFLSILSRDPAEAEDE